MTKTLRLLLLAALCLPAVVPCSGALDPCEIAIIVNSNSADSQRVAEHYCRRRRVPKANIIALPMPVTEIIARQIYDNDIAPRIRQRLSQSDMTQRIKCLLTVWGVPLRIYRLRHPPALQKKLDLIEQCLNERFGQLQQLTADYTMSASATDSQNPAQPFTLPRSRRKLLPKSRAMLKDASAAAQTGRLKLPSTQDAAARQRRLKQLTDLNLQWGGLHSQARELQRRIKSVPADLRTTLEHEFRDLNRRLQPLVTELKSIDPDTTDLQLLKRRYELIYEAAGLELLCPALLDNWVTLCTQETQAAFDSELSLILWDKYLLSGYQNNELCADPPEALRTAQPRKASAKTFMVARLDGPTPAIAMALVDRAVAAEQILLRGYAYIDARGNHGDIHKFGSYGYFDESLRRTAEYLRRYTGLQVRLDDHDALFEPGSCPNTILYCGWYSLARYVASCQFSLGAVGYHIASSEAATLGRGSDPNSTVWCKRMLEEGITATLGPVGEPYLHAFPVPERFFAELVGGKHNLVECYYRTKPFNSWMMTLIGDPLYRPRYAKRRGFQPAP